MKSNTQNARIAAITEKTLVVGIDVGSETHYARAFDWRGIEYSTKPFAFSNDEKGFKTFKAWIESMKIAHGKEDVMPGMEPTGHYWINLGRFLKDNGMTPMHVNPAHVKKSKELDDNNPNKNDGKDPKVIAGLVKEGRYEKPYMPVGVYADIRNLSQQLVQTQSALTRVKNRIARWFSIWFPNYKDVYTNLEAVSGMMILKVAPLPADIVKLGEDGINQIWRDAKLRGAGRKRAKTLLEAAEHSIGSREAQESARYELIGLMDDFQHYKNRQEELMAMVEAKVQEVPYTDKLLEIPGVGMKTVIGFVAEIGDISRFDDPKQLQKLAGLAIVSNESGKHKGESGISYRGRKHLRYVMFEAALSLVRCNAEFRSVYRYYIDRGAHSLKKMQSLIAVACKALRVFYKIMKTGISYDPVRMLDDIKRPEMA